MSGPDGVGKTTQLQRLAAAWSGFQLLGSVHHHDPEPWQHAAQGDYGKWWFELVSTAELTEMLLTSHVRRLRAHAPGRVGLLDRGLPMLLAVAAATSAVKDRLGPDEALSHVMLLAAHHPEAAAAGLLCPAPAAAGVPQAGPEAAHQGLGLVPMCETAVLLLPSRDTGRSLAIARERTGQPWRPPYPDYQWHLHRTLLFQVTQGTYDHVIDCEGLTVEEVHHAVRRCAEPLMSAQPPGKAGHT